MSTEPLLPTADILGVPVTAISMVQAVQEVSSWIKGSQRRYLVVCPVYNLMLCREDNRYRETVIAADLIVPDGMPLVWVCHLLGYPEVNRVYGPDLMLALSEYGLDRGYRHYYYGGSQQALDMLESNLKQRFAGLNVVGSYAPPFRLLTLEEDEAAVQAINAAAPDIVWVGLGTPLQDFWMFAHRSRLRAPVLIGVGAAFNIHAGLLPQAPRWMQRIGLEWFFRLMVEPRRLWRRYLWYNPAFLYHVVRELWSRRRSR